jgi:hypothetical protein
MEQRRNINKEYIQDLKIEYPITFVKSATGTGKTTWLKNEIIKDFSRILVVSFRRTFAIDISRKLGFKNYLDGGNWVKHDKLVCSFEQLYKIQNQKFDLIIFDEIETILQNTTTKETSKNWLNDNQKCLIAFINNTKKVLCMDANLQEESIKTLMNVVKNNRPYEFIINNYKNTRGNVVIYDDKNELLKKMEKDTGNLVVITSSKIESETILWGNVLVINGSKDNSKVFKNFEEECDKYKHIVYTTSLLAGVECKNKKYKNVYAFVDKRIINPLNFIQMIYRFRYIENVYVFFENTGNKKYNLQTREQLRKRLKKELSHCDKCDKYNGETDGLEFYIHNDLMKGMYSNYYHKILCKNLTYNGWKIEYKNFEKEEEENKKKKKKKERNFLKELNIDKSLTKEVIYQLIEYSRILTKEEYESGWNNTEYEMTRYKLVRLFKIKPEFLDRKIINKYINKQYIYYNLRELFQKKQINFEENDLWTNGDDEDIEIDLNDTFQVKFEDLTIHNICCLLKTSKDVGSLVLEYLGKDFKLVYTKLNDDEIVENMKNKNEDYLYNIHSRKYLKYEWLKEICKLMGFKEMFDFETTITQEQKNTFLIRLWTNALKNKEDFEFVFEVNLNGIDELVKENNTRKLSEKLNSLLKKYGMSLNKKRVMRDGVRSYDWNLGWSGDCPKLIGDEAEKVPCIIPYRDFVLFNEADKNFFNSLMK